MPVLLDLFCGRGGAGRGYHLAGYEVVGVDLAPQPRYPFKFIQADATTFPLDGYDAYHASPPCQDHSETIRITNQHGTGWMLQHTVNRLTATGKPWVVENVASAPLPRQDDLFGAFGVQLCGCMFPELRGLIYEDRLFQSSFPVPQPSHVLHIWPQTKMGRKPQPGECMQLTGHFIGAEEGRRRMGVPWMDRDGLAQAIPPAYTAYIGRHMLQAPAA